MNEPGPCVYCGRMNYPRSLGGSGVCPACDCGQFDGAALAGVNDRLRKERDRADRALTLACERLAFGCRTCIDCARPMGEDCPLGERADCSRCTPAMWRDVLMKEADGE